MIPHPEPWHLEALCAEVDPEIFFPPVGDESIAAKRVCLACNVQAECLKYALDNQEVHGIWGGFGERQRRKLKRGEHVSLPKPKPKKPPRVCHACGKDFQGLATAKYCSSQCSRRATYARQRNKRAEKRDAA